MEFVLFFSAVWAIVFGVSCYNIASSKGLEPAGFALAGALLGIFGLIIVLCVPARKA